jgi:hypothetical protein
MSELHLFLVDAAIRPFVLRSVRKLLAAPGRDGTLGLSWAVRNNHGRAIEAYGDMLADPVLLPLVEQDLSRLIRRVLAEMEKQPEASKSPLSPAMRKSRSEALTALRRMLERPEIASRLDMETVQRLAILGTDDTAASEV